MVPCAPPSRRIARRVWPLLLAALGALIGCSGEPEPLMQTDEDSNDLMRRLSVSNVFVDDGEILDLEPSRGATREAFFGDLHVHTTYSFDAYAFGTMATPDDAYRYARGEAIEHPAGFEVQLGEPLDFYAVTDHAMFMGAAAAAGDTSTAFSQTEVGKPLNDLNADNSDDLLSLFRRVRTFAGFLPSLLEAIDRGELDRQETLDITRSAWRDSIEAAERHNVPGRFTTFVAYEYTTSSDDRGNLHRNVIFRGSDRLPAVPFSRFHSQNPEGLWDWLDGLRAQGIEALAIPHNSNGSNGQMFKLEDWAGDPIDDAYARQRVRNEPLVEITQVKGTSETHPVLSARDEWADFEIMPYRVATMMLSEPKGSYVRDALREGIAFESRGVTNPYAFGVIGSSDTHTAAASIDESDYFAKIGLLDATPDLRGSTPMGFWSSLAVRLVAPEFGKEVDGKLYTSSASPTYGASGLAGVWAEENTRASIYDAFRRKETFATSGPRIRLRFFGAHYYDRELIDAPDVVERAYAEGVAMGGELDGVDSAPSFLVWAFADPTTAPLQRVQIVKGWVDNDGETRERVFDVACTDGGRVDPSTHRCPDNGAKVDPDTCAISTDRGAGELRVAWRDPSWRKGQRAFYYARALENPTCRWSTWDALRVGVEPRSDLPRTIQERAWSSPIWIRPDTAPKMGIESASTTARPQAPPTATGARGGS